MQLQEHSQRTRDIISDMEHKHALFVSEERKSAVAESESKWKSKVQMIEESYVAAERSLRGQLTQMQHERDDALLAVDRVNALLQESRSKFLYIARDCTCRSDY